MNGVCVIFVGWLNIVKLEGVGYLMFDEDRANVRSNNFVCRNYVCIYTIYMG